MSSRNVRKILLLNESYGGLLTFHNDTESSNIGKSERGNSEGLILFNK